MLTPKLNQYQTRGSGTVRTIQNGQIDTAKIHPRLSKGDVVQQSFYPDTIGRYIFYERDQVCIN